MEEKKESQKKRNYTDEQLDEMAKKAVEEVVRELDPIVKKFCEEELRRN